MKYRVTFSVEINHTITVEAADEDAAWEQAQEEFDLRHVPHFDYYTDSITKIESVPEKGGDSNLRGTT